MKKKNFNFLSKNLVNIKGIDKEPYVELPNALFFKDYEKEMIGWFNSKATKGPETFRLMYEKMGFKRAVWFSRLPVIRRLFDGSYWVFAHLIRPHLPQKNKK